MKICFITANQDNWQDVATIPDELTSLGCEVSSPRHFDRHCDFIVCMSISQLDTAWKIHRRCPVIPVVNYNWDIYEWAWMNPRPGEYDFHKYGRLLRRSVEVWCPSQCTVDRMRQWYDLENGRVILSSAPYWESDNVGDDRFVLNPLREIPDRYWGLVERACGELGIPIVSSQHKLELAEYRRLVERCSFIVSPLYELSTGGLTLIEGYYHGKPCLLSDSPWHGGRDYMGERPGVVYFRHDSYDDLKAKLLELWTSPPRLDLAECKAWVAERYHVSRMAQDIFNRLVALKG